MPDRVAERWYETVSMGQGVTLIRETHVAPWLRCNIWHVRGRDRDLVIDTGMGLRPLVEAVPGLAVERPAIGVVTHTHFDHSGGLHQFKDRAGHAAEAAIIAAPDAHNTVADIGYVRAETFSALPYDGFDHTQFAVKPAPLTRIVDEGDVLDLGDRVFHVLHLPGHSPGSIALHERESGVLFSGDVVYDDALLDNLYHSDPDVLEASLRRLKELPVSVIHAGHFASFGQGKMVEIIDEYLAGGRRITDTGSYVAAASCAHDSDH
ncbi:Glyoxylase, beta-lactamase superfamily II [Salinihabitans flavidus]|uniref:Glyoxylase, beta-lactamase superfamily II n=1 Tax=Salinihabitans flavidus TaxID=569882 RepID=A0A1H8MS67_9RHOB|nr:MBL fold metallo-hydrolase [Salinihabitans flavidus]SEO20139.1 Glyoxylase, beta-lactamase superfamily II [Salinihabitans flavidus]